MDGILNLDKPAGMTSHDVVARVRRTLGTRRVGHAGTLDPDAVGVLVVAIGQATRILSYLPAEPKEYVARLVLGVATDTEDAGGRVVAERDASPVTEEALGAALERFVGEIDQVPPMVSAVHHQGRRLYELARQGMTVERTARRVRVHSLALSDFVPGPRAEATLRIVCGGGTYVRTLCADIGSRLGVGGHMKSLVREAVGIFRREDALPLSRLAEEWPARVLPMESALRLPVRAVSDEEAARLLRGQAIPATGVCDSDTYALTHLGRLRALARDVGGGGVLQPFKVFPFDSDPESEHAL